MQKRKGRIGRKIRGRGGEERRGEERESGGPEKEMAPESPKWTC